MTDDEIIKALECCAQPILICSECPYYDIHVPYPCADQLKWAALNLIDSQKAEIERLNTENMLTLSERNAFRTSFYEVSKQLKTAKSEAVREFAERLKENLQWDVEYDNKLVFESDIDNLVKEMVGDTE